MFALGMAGVCGSFYGSFTPSGSLSRTSLASEVHRVMRVTRVTRELGATEDWFEREWSKEAGVDLILFLCIPNAPQSESLK